MIKMGFIGFRFSSAQLGQVAKNLTENGKMRKNGPGGNFFLREMGKLLNLRENGKMMKFW